MSITDEVKLSKKIHLFETRLHYIQLIFNEYSMNIQWIFNEQRRDQWIFNEYSINLQWIFNEQWRD